MVSVNYRQEAVDRGWYNPASGSLSSGRKFMRPAPGIRHQPLLVVFYYLCPSYKQCPTVPWRRFLPGTQPILPICRTLSLYPFSVKTWKKISVRDIMAFQRSTFEGNLYDLTSGPQWLVRRERRIGQSPWLPPSPQWTQEITEIDQPPTSGPPPGALRDDLPVERLAAWGNRRHLLGLPG